VKPSDPVQTRSLPAKEGAATAEHAYLLVVEGETSRIVPVPGQGVLLIGRGEDADVRLNDSASSRRHARIVIADGEARLTDLGSRNGTRVNGEPIEGARTLATGDVVAIGDASLVLRLHRAASAPNALLDLPSFQRRLREETERALAYGRPLTVVALGPADPQRLARLAESELRLIDLAACSEDGRLLVAMPEIGGEAAEARAHGLLTALTPAAPEANAGLAACPQDGCDGGSLLEAARAAAAAAEKGKVALAVTLATEVTLGERTVLLADPAMLRIYELIRRVAATDLPVLVSGETGVGKENAAFAVHFHSPRRNRPFVTLNCAAIQDTLLESELFGYEKGAFSGATGAKPGLLETTEGGTVFLDEVGELSPSAQAKLLRALETRRITRVGGVREREIDLRMVAATNRDLEEEVRSGRFRQDLFFRLSAATVVLPPLRERPRELLLLARRFLEHACGRGCRTMRIEPATLQLLSRYAWPGNVRELKNVMELLAATVPEDAIAPSHLPPKIRGPSPESVPAPAPEAAPAARAFRPLVEELREIERTRMIEALEAAQGVQKRAAELIGMPLRTFVLKYRQHGLASIFRSRR
jgi:DNA-binding NtrC family response regulator